MSDSANLLRTSANVLRKHGWCQGHLHLGDGTHCALGAMLVAMCEIPDLNTYLDALETLRATAQNTSIAGWNDAPGRTAEEVIAAFEAAAMKCESADGLRSEKGQSDSGDVQGA